jgi:P4 family phage/plasmid primase-like protien
MSNVPMLFDEYLKRNICEKGDEYTHTRMPNQKFKISGGTFSIKNEEDFLKNYYKHVFINGNHEHLTEKQLIEKAPLAIDIDMRYEPNITERQHDEDDIRDLIHLYATAISNICVINNKHKIEVFIMEKHEVNILKDKTKDGIHIIFGISMHRAGHILIREEVIKEIKNLWQHLPLINSEEDLIDEAVTRAHVPWQLYGSKKPDHKAYFIKYHYELEWSGEDRKWIWQINDIEKFNTKKYLPKLSVRYTKHPEVDFQDKIKDKIEEYKLNINKKQRKMSSKITIKKTKGIDLNDITNTQKLDDLVNEMLEQIEERPNDYELKETHQFVMILPEKYWGPGSYDRWIRVGWALKNTSTKLLPCWLKFSSQSKEFHFNDIAKIVDMWNKFDYDNPDGLTARSIMYWAKNDNIIQYKKVREETVSHYIDLTIQNATEFDFAQVLYQMRKDEFVCVSIQKSVWYEYHGNRWYEIDSGNSLRLAISKCMHDIYMKKTQDSMEQLQKMDQTEDNYEVLRKRSNKLADLCIFLKKTTWKNNIMREAKELFYDRYFVNKLDQNPYLLCFNNFVVDFKEKTWRNGQPDDYISKCTNIDLIPYNEIKGSETENDINKFIDQLFPDESLKKYMWQHLASTLIGNNDNQTFNMYTGSGRNGKSKLVDLMSKTLGDYKATVPITLLTQKRNQIGSTSSEIVQLMGVRYAVMQEPSKGEKINEGIMKEITGGDPIQGRALFKESVTFIPQFKLVVCTNTLLDIKSNDDGTWRRIRVCDFISKFLENPYGDEQKFPKEDYPYQYEMDKHIDEKFSIWAPVLASMLVNITFKKMGSVTDCDIVLASSEQYREGQDYLAEFCKDKIKKVHGSKGIKKTELVEEFRQWYTINYGKGLPKARELYDHMDKKYGKYKAGWANVVINYDEDESDED